MAHCMSNWLEDTVLQLTSALNPYRLFVMQLAPRQLLEKTDALLKGMPQMQALGQQAGTSGAFASVDAYSDAR